MPIITFIDHNGFEHVVDAPTDTSLMKAAVLNGIEGIEALCGGELACATCHCYIDEAWLDRIPVIGDVEEDMLDEVIAERRPGSRLSCQIPVTDELNGLVVRLPNQQ